MAGNHPIDERYDRRARFVLLTAEGKTPAELAAEFKVSTGTIYNWKKRPKVIAELEAYSRELIKTAARRFSNQFIFAIDELTRLAKEAKSEQVRLSALCKIVDHLEKTLDRLAKLTDNGTDSTAPRDQTYAELHAELHGIIARSGGFLPESGTYEHEPIDVDSAPVQPPPSTNGNGHSNGHHPPSDEPPDAGPSSNGHGPNGNGKPPMPPSNGNGKH